MDNGFRASDVGLNRSMYSSININPSSAPGDYSCPGIYLRSASGNIVALLGRSLFTSISRGLRKQLKAVLQELVAAAFL